MTNLWLTDVPFQTLRRYHRLWDADWEETARWPNNVTVYLYNVLSLIKKSKWVYRWAYTVITYAIQYPSYIIICDYKRFLSAQTQFMQKTHGMNSLVYSSWKPSE